MARLQDSMRSACWELLADCADANCSRSAHLVARALLARLDAPEPTDEAVAFELVGAWKAVAGLDEDGRASAHDMDRALVWVRAVNAARERAQKGAGK